MMDIQIFLFVPSPGIGCSPLLMALTAISRLRLVDLSSSMPYLSLLSEDLKNGKPEFAVKTERTGMTLQERIKSDLKIAMKEKNEAKKDTLRVVIGEFGRSDKKELSDDEILKILKKLVKSEKEVLEKKGETESKFIEVIETYLPKMATEQDIENWIRENVDFSKFKNKMQAMGVIMKHFGSSADGNAVKNILQGF